MSSERVIPRWKWMEREDGTFYMERWGSGDWVTFKDHTERIADLEAERDALKGTVSGWIKENGPGGWIDNLRAENKRLSKPVTDEEHDRHFNENCGTPLNPEWAARCKDVDALLAARKEGM